MREWVADCHQPSWLMKGLPCGAITSIMLLNFTCSHQKYTFVARNCERNFDIRVNVYLWIMDVVSMDHMMRWNLYKMSVWRFFERNRVLSRIIWRFCIWSLKEMKYRLSRFDSRGFDNCSNLGKVIAKLEILIFIIL